MSMRMLLIVGAMLATAQAPARAQAPAAPSSHGIDPRDWNRPHKPLRIYGTTWYVGPYGLSSILLDTGHGLVLFDGDLKTSPPVIEANIRTLGFRVRDIRWILNSHVHQDHAGGIATLQRDSGAQVVASAAGSPVLARGGDDPADPQYGILEHYPPVRRVRAVADGEVLDLGGAAVTAHYTPGHTPGSTSWSWTSCEGQRCLHMVYADSLSAISAPGFRFSDHPGYVARFRQAIATVAALPCDILLTPHPDASDFWQKVARRRSAADSAPFIDRGACRAYAAAATARLDRRLAQERAGTHVD